MRKKIRKKIFLIILWIAVYFAGLFCGIKVISFMPGEWKRDDLEYAAKQRMTEYESNGRVSNWSAACIAVIIYDAEGSFQDFFRMDGKPFEINFLDESMNDLDSVLQGNKTLSLYMFVGNYSKIGYTSLIYIGIPMTDTDTGEITGAFFWIKECPDLVETVLGYAVIFTVFCVVIILVFLFSLLRERRIMALPRKYIDNITHELKSPIASIKALTEALSDDMAKSQDEKSVYYGMILKEANKQEKMISGVLELSKLENDRALFEKSVVTGEELFGELCETYRNRCDLYDVQFIVDDSIKTIPNLFTNKDGMTQVINNVVNNAIKFSPPEKAVSLSAEYSGGKVIICVEDQGKGISKQDLPHVFDRFYKDDSLDNASGSGLGLALAQEVMKSMHEKIWIESTEGIGTRVYFTIKLARRSRH